MLIFFRVHAKDWHSSLEEPLTDDLRTEEAGTLPGAFSLTSMSVPSAPSSLTLTASIDITLHSSSEQADLTSHARLFVELTVEDEAFDRTLPVTQDTHSGVWKCDGELSLSVGSCETSCRRTQTTLLFRPAGIPFALDVYAEGDEQDAILLGTLAVTGEALLAASNDKQSKR